MFTIHRQCGSGVYYCYRNLFAGNQTDRGSCIFRISTNAPNLFVNPLNNKLQILRCKKKKQPRMRCARVLAPLSSPNFLDAALRSRRVGIVGTVLSHSAEEVPKKALEQVAQLRPKTVWREGGNSEHLASFFLVCFSLFW